MSKIEEESRREKECPGRRMKMKTEKRKTKKVYKVTKEPKKDRELEIEKG